MNNPLIELHHIYKAYPQGEHIVSALQNICLSINSGEMVAIIGTSGSGKSTLMNIIGLLDQSFEGTYTLAGQHIQGLADEPLAHLRNRRVGFVFQHFHLLPRLTALQNVALPLLYRGYSQEYSEKKALGALSQIDMSRFATRRPSQLSGGQQQRIAIARALVGSPDMILADEPTGALDSGTSEDIMRIFHELHAQGKTILMITHEDWVALQCKRQIVIHDGKIISDMNIKP